MTVYLPKGGKTYVYDFWWRGQRHTDTTHQTRRGDAELVESQVKLRLRQQAGGVQAFNVEDTPRIQDWANVFLKEQRKFIGRVDVLERTLGVVLEFWGAPPRKPRGEPAVKRARRVAPPYHDLRLGHPIANPAWLLKFEQWMEQRGVAGSTRNSYLSAMSGMYRLALQPKFRSVAGVATNPFRDIRRAPPRRRLVALPVETILVWIQKASYHVALAATIAALAPKLRVATILQLRWDEHFDADLTTMTVPQHKTAARSGLPQVTPISQQLRTVLLDARERGRARGAGTYVVEYRDQPVASIKRGAKRATEATGLKWGLLDGVTFHTIRHSIATLLAKLGMPERIRMELMGHSEIRTTQQYTHLAAEVQVEPHEQLSRALPLQDVLIAKPRPKAKKTKRRVLGKFAGPAPQKARKSAKIVKSQKAAAARVRGRPRHFPKKIA